MSQIFRLIVTVFFAFSILTVHADSIKAPHGLTEKAKTSEITPDIAYKTLVAGNKRFSSNTSKRHNLLLEAKKTDSIQNPFAVILNCMDSESIPEFVFDTDIGDLFVIKIAGNIINQDILGSLEFATKIKGAKLIVVLGHTECETAIGACQDINLGHLDNILDKIKPSVFIAKRETGLKICSKQKLSTAIAKYNAVAMAKQIIIQSPVIRQLVGDGKVKVVAGLHHVKTGQVTFFE